MTTTGAVQIVEEMLLTDRVSALEKQITTLTKRVAAQQRHITGLEEELDEVRRGTFSDCDETEDERSAVWLR